MGSSTDQATPGPHSLLLLTEGRGEAYFPARHSAPACKCFKHRKGFRAAKRYLLCFPLQEVPRVPPSPSLWLLVSAVHRDFCGTLNPPHLSCRLLSGFQEVEVSGLVTSFGPLIRSSPAAPPLPPLRTPVPETWLWLSLLFIFLILDHFSQRLRQLKG